MVTNTDDISLRCDHVTSDDASSVTGIDDNHNNNTDDDLQKIEENLTFAFILSGKCNSTQTM